MVIYFTIIADVRAGFIVAKAETLSQNPLGMCAEESSSSQSQPTQIPAPTAYQETQAETAP